MWWTYNFDKFVFKINNFSRSTFLRVEAIQPSHIVCEGTPPCVQLFSSIEFIHFFLIFQTALNSELLCKHILDQWDTTGGNGHTMMCPVADLHPLPPESLPPIPCSGFPSLREDPSDGLSHGFGRFPRPVLKRNTGRVNHVIPEVVRELKILVSELCPSIDLSVASKDTDTCETYLCYDREFAPR